MNLSASDQILLTRILQRARHIELAWPVIDRQHKQNLGAHPEYVALRRDIAACAESESAALSRLADRAAHLHHELSLTHFYACVVPFERLVARALRDDEFLVSEGDDRQRQVARVPLKLVVENLRSSFNVGAIFRTAECLGLSEIVLTGYTPGPDDEKTSRTSMGTADLVPWRRVDRAFTACSELHREGYKLIALETAAGADSLSAMDFSSKPTAFVIGNERFGVDADTLAAVDAICRIPLRGIKNSLNVGIAFGIAGFEWLRQFESRK